MPGLLVDNFLPLKSRIILGIGLWTLVLGLICYNFHLSSLSWKEVRAQVGWVKTIPQKSNIKLRHIIQYAPLSMAAGWATIVSFSVPPIGAAVTGIVVASVSGGLEEYHQASVPSRIPSWADVFWNIIGGIVGAVLFWYSRKLGIKILYPKVA